MPRALTKIGHPRKRLQSALVGDLLLENKSEHKYQVCMYIDVQPRIAVAAAKCNIANSNGVVGHACACSSGYRGSIKWKGDQPSGTCTPTQCTGPRPTAPANGTVRLTNGVKHGSKAIFTCNDGFSLSGASSVVCDAEHADKDWPALEEAPKCTGW